MAFFRRLHIETPMMSHRLRSKIGIVADLEKIRPMRLQLVFLPDQQHGGRTDFWLVAVARTLQ